MLLTMVKSPLHQYDDTMSSLLDKHAPLQTRTITVRPNVPWFNGDIKMAKQKRRQLDGGCRQSRLTVHLDNIFKEQKRHVNKLISSAKSFYYTAKIIEAVSDQKQIYNVVNTMLVKPEASLPDASLLVQLGSKCEIFFNPK